MEMVLVAFVGVVLFGAAIIVYLRAQASRRTYCCPQCGQRVRVELMGATHCNVCGTPLRQPMK